MRFLLLCIVIFNGCTAARLGLPVGNRKTQDIVKENSKAERNAIEVESEDKMYQQDNRGIEVKVCPKCNRVYTSSIFYCPYDGEALKYMNK